MKKINIGKSDLKISPLVLGGNVFGWTANEEASFNILDSFIERGFNMIDTADVYSTWIPGHKGGESETIIGNWLNRTKKREDVLIATKVGSKFSETQSGLKKAYIIAQVEESLKRLQTDYIDLYYTHYDDLDTPIEETLEAYALLVKQGKVRYIGASNMSPERLKESLLISKQNNYPEYICLQAQYNLYDRKNYEQQYEKLLLELGLGSLPYYSLASGFLTGKYKKMTDIASAPRNHALQSYMNERGENIIEALDAVAQSHNRPPAQIALAWMLANSSVTAPIASVSKTNQLDILECVNISLSKEDLDRLDKASAY